MESWAMFWKGFVILGVGVFAAVSLWVTIAGLSDIRRMFRQLRQESEPSGREGDRSAG